MGEPTIRYVVKEDCSLILYFIRKLATYEKMLDEVIATEDLISIFH